MSAPVSKRSGLDFARLTAAALACAVSTLPAFAAETRGTFSPDKIARGKYLVTITGCNDCHTPFKMGPNGPAPDMSRMLSGHPESFALPPAPAAQGPWVVAAAATNTAWSGPWGVSFTSNLTPDSDTGLGSWTLRNFVDTIRSGRHLGAGRQILPPMPIPMYKQMTDEDLEAVFAYLKSIPPVKNRVPQPLPAAK